MTNFIAYAICIYIIIYYISSEHYIYFIGRIHKDDDNDMKSIFLFAFLYSSQRAALSSPTRSNENLFEKTAFSYFIRAFLLFFLCCLLAHISVENKNVNCPHKISMCDCLKCIENIFLMFIERCNLIIIMRLAVHTRYCIHVMLTFSLYC